MLDPAASGGVCDDPTKTLGVEIKPSCGVEIKFAAGKSNSNGEAPVDVTLGVSRLFRVFQLHLHMCPGLITSPDRTSSHGKRPLFRIQPGWRDPDHNERESYSKTYKRWWCQQLHS